MPSKPPTLTVRVYVITYRRPQLLRRALCSLVAQKHSDWVAEVLNDDPSDGRVSSLIDEIADPRIHLSEPSVHRGATANFNYAFRLAREPFASILEDDNWWQPDFLQVMLAALAANPTASLAVGNETIWRELPDGGWENTHQTLWPVDLPDRLVAHDALAQAGGSRLCNSSLLFRTAAASSWQTPQTIPVDVSEHFRERIVEAPYLLVSRPMVNYAETLQTARLKGPAGWGEYQALLIGSTLALCPEIHRTALAQALWNQARRIGPWAGTALLAVGDSQPEARALWELATAREKLRFRLGSWRHRRASRRIAATRDLHPELWEFLLRGSFADYMRQWQPDTLPSGTLPASGPHS